MSNVDTSPLGIERAERIAGDEALNSRLDNVTVELQGTQESVTTEVLHRSEGDLVIQRILEGYIQDLLDGKTEELERYLDFQNSQNLNYEDVRDFVGNIRASLAEEIRNLTDTLMTNLQANDVRYNKLVSDVDRYVEILSDITLDSNQITLDDGELRAGAWTILSQARQWDLDIINRLNGLSASVGDSLKDAVEEIQNQLPSTEETISKAIEELSKSPQIKELSDALNSAIEDVTALDVALIREHAERQRALSELAAQQADALANEKALLLDRLATESQERVDAILREATIRQQLLLDEAAVRQQALLDEAAERTAEVNAEVVARKEAIDELAEQMLTRADLDKAEFQSGMVTVTNRIKNAEDGLTSEIQHRKDGDTATLNALNVYKVSNDSAITGLSTSLSNNVTKTNANTTLINGLTARMTTAEDGIESATTAAADAMTKATTAVDANSALSIRVDALAASITEGDGTEVDVNAFNALKAEVTSVQGTVTGLTEDVTTLESNYTSVNNMVNSHGTSISTLNNKMIAAEDSISQSANDITLLKTDITTINSSLLTKVDSQAFSQLSSDVTELEGNLTTQAGLVTDLRGSLDTTNVNVGNAATAAQNAMNAAGAKGKVIYGTTAPAVADRLSQNLWIDTTGGANTPKRWNGSAWVAVTDKVATDALAAANAAKNLANTKADASAFNSLDQKVTVMDGKVSTNTNSITSLTGKISTVEGAIATKLDSSAISNYYTKQQTDDKASEIAAGKVEEFSAGLVIGGVNQLLNSEGERSSTATTRREYLLYEKSAHLMEFYNEYLGKDVTISFDLKVDVAGSVQVYASNNSAHSYSTGVSVKAEDVGVWKRYSVTVKPKVHTASTTASTLEFYGTYDTGRIPHVRKVQLEAGNVATDWSPSPRDTQAALDANSNAIQDVNAEVERVDGEVTANNSAITSLTGRVSTVEGAVATKADASAFNALTTRVANTENTNTSQGTAITSLQNTVNHSTTGLATKASTSALNVTKSDVTRIDGTVSGHANQLAQLTSDINTINGTLSTKANASALNDIYTKSQTDAKATEIAAGKVEEFSASISNEQLQEMLVDGDNAAYSDGSLYQIAGFTMKEPREIGATYTLRFKMTINRSGSDTTSYVRAYQGGNAALPRNYTEAKDTIYEVTFTATSSTPTNEIRFYHFPNTPSAKAGTSVTIHWASLIKANDDAKAQTQAAIDANATAIQATNADVVKVDDRVTVNSNSITGLTSRLGTAEGLLTKKADASALNNHYTKAEADDEALEIAAGEVSKYDASLVIGGTNLQPGTQGGNFGSYQGQAFVEKDGEFKTKIVRFDKTLTGPRGIEMVASARRTPLIKGNKYILSFYVKGTLPLNYVYLMSSTATGANSSLSAVDLSKVNSTTFTKVEFPFTATANRTNAYVMISSTGSETGWLEIAEIMFQEGTKSTPWEPSYIDTQSALDANATAISNTNTEIERVDNRVTTESNRITSLTGRVDTVEGELTKKATVSALNSLTTRVEKEEGKSSAQATSITNLTSSLNTIGTDLSNVETLARLMTSANLVREDPTFSQGVNGVSGYRTNTANVLSRVPRPSDNPTTSTHEMQVVSTGQGSSTGSFGGFYAPVTSRANAVFVVKYIVKMPVGYRMMPASNSVGTGGSNNFVGSTEGTGKYETYLRVIRCGSEGSFSTSGHVYFAGSPVPTTSSPVTFHIASIETYDTTDYNDRSAGVASAISTLSSDVSEIEGTVTSQGQAITNLENTVNHSTTGLASKASSSALTTLNNQVQHSTTGLSAVNSKVDNLKATIENPTNGLASKASSSALDTLSNKVNHSTTGLDAIANKTTVLESDVSKALDVVTIKDTRSTNQPPSWYWSNYPKRTVNEFKTQTAIGVGGFFGGTYCNLETNIPYGDSSGGHIVQTATSSADPSLYVQRVSTSTTAWGAWKQPIKDLRDGLNGKAAASALSSLETKVTAIDGTVTSQASQLTVLTSDNNNNKNALSVQGKVIDGVKANYMVKMETNGVLAGFGLIQSSGAMGTVTSTFGVNANNFFIGAPSGGKKPFVVTTANQVVNGVTYPAGTWIDVAMIANATIGTAKIDDLAVKTAKIDNGAITTAKIGDLQVETLKIKDWAVTKPFIYESTDKTFTGSYTITHSDLVQRMIVTASGFTPGALVMVSLNSDLYITNRESGVNTGVYISGIPTITLNLNGVSSRISHPTEEYAFMTSTGLRINNRSASIPGTIMYTTYANASGQVTARLYTRDGDGNNKAGTVGWITHNKTTWMMQEFKK